MIQTSAIFRFPKSLMDRPVICRVIRDFDVEVNIIQAHITPEEDGHMFAIVRGRKAAMDGAFGFLRDNDVQVILPAKNLVWDEEVCVHCGACTAQCPSGAFVLDPATAKVIFDAKKCIACELCIPACSYRAIESIGSRLGGKGDLP